MDIRDIHRAEPFTVAASHTPRDALFKTYRTQFLEQMHQGQHGTKHAEKTLFKKHSCQKTAGEDHGHHRKRKRHRIGEIEMEISHMSDKERQNGPGRANLTKRKSPVRMEAQVGNAQRDEKPRGPRAHI